VHLSPLPFQVNRVRLAEGRFHEITLLGTVPRGTLAQAHSWLHCHICPDALASNWLSMQSFPALGRRKTVDLESRVPC
jgi:hypothetical protein